jgi:hypothetical protein
MSLHRPLIIPADTSLYAKLQTLVQQARQVFFAGLPGTGKSLLLHQLTHLAVAHGRTVHLLQWDIARPVFEAAPSARRYPVVDGVTHGIIRKAVGMWARQRLTQWESEHVAPQHLLIGETPFIGNRFIELARPIQDTAEQIFQHTSCRFVIPVPSLEVRARIETTRQQRSRTPVHPHETEDAPPPVLEALWREVYRAAPLLGVATDTVAGDARPAFDPDIYSQVYQALLKHRHCDVMPLDIALETAGFSPYDFIVEKREVVPSADDVATYIAEAEQRFPEPEALQRAIDQWYRIDTL